MWFEETFGFSEADWPLAAPRFEPDGEYVVSVANSRRMRWGRFEMPSLAELRARVTTPAPGDPDAAVREIVGDISAVHADPVAAGATFQVASQFNMLEMVGPDVTPGHGIDRYEFDHTQGPACAIACGAGTLYRNYFVPLGDHLGQSEDDQLDGLTGVADALDVHIPMHNGYALPDPATLGQATDALAALDDAARDTVRGALRVGVQHDTEVTLARAGHTVTQVFCSAVPVSYSAASADAWEPLARIVLEATYEAALLIAAETAARTGNRTVYLTMVGGGAFGNRTSWIIGALERAIHCAGAGLDIALVSYQDPNPAIAHLVGD